MPTLTEVALALIKLAIEIAPSLAKAISIVEGHEHALALAEILKPGNEAQQLLDEPRP